MIPTAIPNAAQLAQDPSNVHNLVYFPIHGLAGCIRTTLILSDEQHRFTFIDFALWRGAEKELTPLGHVPVLREETKCGKTLEIAEISVIEHFLASRAGLLGKDYWEECRVKMYLSSTHTLITFLVQSVVQSPKDTRPAFVGRFMKRDLSEWIRFHEAHLKANGSNGHYVGDQLSIADIKTASVLEHLIYLCGDDIQISEELTPAIMAVKTNLEKDPKYAEWRASEQYQQLTAANIQFFGF